ncbi:MAG: hypothetical protein D3926_10150 [Desulfobacteraceae bacterium]|nr:MAG: hypothetical protein D3926_10150 [Desulfobacteraceae bacterium]
MTHHVTFFKPCELKEGQKIRIEDSPLEGDWEIVKVTPFKVTIRCPFSKKELTKDRFFFFTREETTQWPQDD